jgi:GntR family transcriptional regulator
MTRWTGRPAYQQIADQLRAQIRSGALAPGQRLPSESALTQQNGVSRVVARQALDVLRAEGLILSHQGKGSFVKDVRRITRDSVGRYARGAGPTTSPFERDASASGQGGAWEHTTERLTADADVARRLAIEPGDPIVRTRYRYITEGVPVQISTSWEPAALTAGTPIERPEDGAAVGVIARMDLIGEHIDRVVEKVTARAAHPEEVERLALDHPYVLVIDRTHYVGERPVETADIVFPGDRYELTYRIPVDP